MAALRKFRDSRGRVVLLSNAPRPKRDVEAMFQRFGIPLDCYDEIVTSGIATRLDLQARSTDKTLRMFHLGPERDRGIFEGLNIELAGVGTADIVLNSGLFDDDTEIAGRLCRPAGADEDTEPAHAVRQSGSGGAARRQADLVRGGARRCL